MLNLNEYSKKFNFLKRNLIRTLQNKKSKVIISIANKDFSPFAFRLISALLQYGIDVDFLEFSSEPALIYLTKRFNYSLGIYFVGDEILRCFSSNGEILTIENKTTKLKKTRAYGEFNYCSNLINIYARYIKSKFYCPHNNFLFFSDNDYTTKEIRMIFKHFKIKELKLFETINLNIELEKIKECCVKSKKMGVLIYECGKKCVLIDEFGNIFKSKDFLKIFAKQYLKAGDIVGVDELASVKDAKDLENLGFSVQMLDNFNFELNLFEFDEIVGFKGFTTYGNGCLVAGLLNDILRRTKAKISDLI